MKKHLNELYRIVFSMFKYVWPFNRRQFHIPAFKKGTILSFRLNKFFPFLEIKNCNIQKDTVVFDRFKFNLSKRRAWIVETFILCLLFWIASIRIQLKIDGEIHIYLFHDGSLYYIETRLSSWNSFQTSVPFLPFSESMLSPEAFWYSQMGQEQNYLYIVSD